MNGLETISNSYIEESIVEIEEKETSELKEMPDDIESGNGKSIELPDVSYIERTTRVSLLEQFSVKATETKAINETTTNEFKETKSEGLTEEEKQKIKEETGWSDEIIDHIDNMDQYAIYKDAGLHEETINGRKCLVKEIDMDYEDPKTGMTNRELIDAGRSPIDSKTGEKIELHHILLEE